jgi:8-oxo-dGTP pyrophosphatase MutT (NUDIX family)
LAPILITRSQPATIRRMINALRRKISMYQPSSIDGDESVRAAVLIPVFQKDTQTHILLTKRTNTVKYHKDEISFPGGVYEEDDGNALTTAIRESAEEIGMRPEDVEIVGQLDDMHTFTGFVITPYVGFIPFPYDFTLNSDEVSYLIYLPLSHLLTHEQTMESVDFKGGTAQAPAIYYEGERIWGATCRILFQLRSIIQDET